jgi:hypothetical protein
MSVRIIVTVDSPIVILNTSNESIDYDHDIYKNINSKKKVIFQRSALKTKGKTTLKDKTDIMIEALTRLFFV